MIKYFLSQRVKISLLFLSIILAIFLLSIYSGRASNSADAIAIRILPNNQHYSAARWYQEQKFAGSPQLITVDGYEAVRDGRTVYVAAANVKDVDNDGILSKSDILYTNIYLISYNQEAENATFDIFGQILMNWKFNTNITQSGRCKQAPETLCYYTSDCASGDYCQSSHAIIVRDVKRLADLSDTNSILDNYKNNHNGFCPKLLSGSYLPNKSVSTWSSWQTALSAELGAPLPIDPVNKLGLCKYDSNENKKYNPITCWDEADKIFATATSSSFELPIGSLAYFYTSTPDGKTCSFSAPTESGMTCEEAGNCAVNITKGYCGDSSVQIGLGEQCDDGNNIDNDACNNGCRWNIKTDLSISFSGQGTADALVYDDNKITSSITNKNGDYLKLDKMLDTPYAWFADTNNNLISQVRTYVKCYSYGTEDHPDDKWNLDPSAGGKTGYICPKKIPDGWDYSFTNHQHPGQIITDFMVSGYPSRTAVNVETNEVWVAARSTYPWGGPGHVEKLQMNPNGDYSRVATIPSSEFLGLGRGLTIQSDGDIWTADCTNNKNTASIKRFSASTLELNKTIGADGSFLCPYGLAIDSEDNIWMNDMGNGGLKKINVNTGQIYTYTNGGIYGITVDNNDNAWGGGYAYGYGIKKIPYGQNSGAVSHYTGFTDWRTNMTGVTMDNDGNIWGGGFSPKYETFKFNQNGELQPGFPVSSGGVTPHGVFGTSDGYVWQSHMNSNIIRVFNPDGGVVADFKGGRVASGIYTYSDATGLNRAMVMRSGLWVSDPVDSKVIDQHWGNIIWQQSIPSTKQSLEVYARADNDAANLKNKLWVRVYLLNDPDNVGNTWNALSFTDAARTGRYLQFKVLLRSTERGLTPVIWDLKVQ